MESLHAIGSRHGTDKAGACHLWGKEGYLHIYDRYFSQFRDQPITLIEIGVKQGKSIRMWSEYLPKATVIGVDVDKRCMQYETERVKIVIGDQASKAVTDRVLKLCAGPVAIVVDDGSHLNERTLKTYSRLWPSVASGGYYVFEDMKTSYRWDIVEDMKRGGWKQSYIKGNEHNDRKVLDKFILSNVRKMDHRSGSIRSVHLHSMTYLFEKV